VAAWIVTSCDVGLGMWDLGLWIFHVGCQQLWRVRALVRERLLGGWRLVVPTVGFSLDSFHLSIVGLEMSRTL
jgi:hypothetical protein